MKIANSDFFKETNYPLGEGNNVLLFYCFGDLDQDELNDFVLNGVSNLSYTWGYIRAKKDFVYLIDITQNRQGILSLIQLLLIWEDEISWTNNRQRYGNDYTVENNCTNYIKIQTHEFLTAYSKFKITQQSI